MTHIFHMTMVLRSCNAHIKSKKTLKRTRKNGELRKRTRTRTSKSKEKSSTLIVKTTGINE